MLSEWGIIPSQKHLLSGVLLLFSGTSMATAQPTAGSCSRQALSVEVGMVGAVAWGQKDASIWLADAARGRLLEIASDGRLLRTVERPGHGDLDFLHPSELVRVEGGYRLKNQASHFIWLNSAMEPVRALNFQPQLRNKPVDGELYLFDEIWQGERLYGHGSLRRSTDKKPIKGLYEFRLGSSLEVVRTLLELGVPGRFASHDGYVRPLLAVADGKPFFLTLDTEQPGIFSIEPELKRLQSFPVGFEKLPELPWQKPGSFGSETLALQAATMPVGLYGAGKSLFLLTRRPSPKEGATLWELTKLDPTKDCIVRTFPLPTEAPDILLLPGDTSWALIEKGLAGADEVQPIRALLLIPRKWIEEDAGTEIVCP